MSFDGLVTEKLGLRTEGEVPPNWSPKNILLAVEPRDHLNDFEILLNYLKLRIDDGRGETMMSIGLEDSGESMRLTEAQANTAFDQLASICPTIDAHATKILSETIGDAPNNSCVIRAMVRKQPDTMEDALEIRIAAVGNVDSGKSTMLGVLTKGGLDDGRGKARVNLFRHKHEIESGRTSSVGMEILGFDAKCQPVMSETGRKLTWEEVSKKTAKFISFVDLAGHERYLKTTIFGLCGCAPDYVMLMVGANAGLIGMSKEHLGIALALHVPVFIVITKIDMVSF